MGVQDVVARLNKSKSATTSSSKTLNAFPMPPMPKRNISNNKQLPPSPAASPTSTINKGDSGKNTPQSNGIASMLQRFEKPPTTTTTNTTNTITPSAPTGTTTTPTAKPITPPESPLQQQNKLNVTHIPKNATSMLSFDATVAELVDLFQALLDQNAAAEEYIKTLKQDVEKYSSDATKVRDYEIRVEYLALKLEQVSEERDYFEQELNDLANKHKQQQQQQQQQQRQQQQQQQQQHQSNVMSSPLSPAFSHLGQQDIVIEEEQELQNQNNEAYMADLLNVYEEISDQGEGDDLQLFDEQSASQIQSQQEEIEILNDKLVECDRGVQIALMKYVTDLETQRLETKALKQVVKKQDELITKLETKLKTAPENPDELLKEQVEVQRVELENKRELLAQLLNEREDLLRRLNSNQRNSLLRTSSIDIINTIAGSKNNQRPSSYSSVGSSGRGTPPLTAPPKQPLPPLPTMLS